MLNKNGVYRSVVIYGIFMTYQGEKGGISNNKKGDEGRSGAGKKVQDEGRSGSGKHVEPESRSKAPTGRSGKGKQVQDEGRSGSGKHVEAEGISTAPIGRSGPQTPHVAEPHIPPWAQNMSVGQILATIMKRNQIWVRSMPYKYFSI